MQNSFKSLLAVIFLALPAWSQVVHDTAEAKKEQPARSDTVSARVASKSASDSAATLSGKHPPPARTFKDEKGNGVDDSLETQSLGRKGGQDKFIDMDGDGICDGRESGMGFRHGKAGNLAPGGGKGGSGRQKQGRGGR
jgi:hypothetical protein